MDINFSTSRNAVVLLGDNACGKSTVLDSIAFMAGPLLERLLPGTAKDLTRTDVHYDREGRAAPYLEVMAWFEAGAAGTVYESRTIGLYGTVPDSHIEEIERLADTAKEDNSLLPVFAYYGTGRGHIGTTAHKQNAHGFRRTDCYRDALDPSAGFGTFLAWYAAAEEQERAEAARHNFPAAYRLPALQAVRKALARFVGHRFHSPRTETHPPRFVMSEYGGICMDRDMGIGQMSDGYKIMTAMVADIAARMAMANPHMDDPLFSPGIILVDEIDLHLHPKWQRTVVAGLTDTFPNAQFIATTHSPVVVAGAAGTAQVVRLVCRDDSLCDDIEAEQDLETMDIGQILLSDLFGLPSLRPPMWDHLLARRDELLASASLSEAENSELERINAELSVLQTGNTPVEIRTARLLAEIAGKLGVKL